MTETALKPKVAFYILSYNGFNYACSSMIAVIACKARHKVDVNNYEITAFTPHASVKRLKSGVERLWTMN